MRKTLEAYQQKLFNLNSNNRSILLGKIRSGLAFDLSDFHYVLQKPTHALLQNLVQGKHIPLCALVDPRDAHNNTLSKQLAYFKRQSELIYTERGVQNIYIGFPMVRGALNNGQCVYAPLCLFPVELENSNQWILHSKTSAFGFNKALLLAYSHFNEHKIDHQLFREEIELDFHDLLSFKNWLYQWIKTSEIGIHFNQALFEEQVQPYRFKDRKSLEAEVQIGQLKLQNEAVLGIFRQDDAALEADYATWLQRDLPASLEDFFIQKWAKDPKVLGAKLEQQLFTPLRIDASQEQCIQHVKDHQSLVVEGPPGTGKSQLIVNLISDFCARGKKVLVVSQKRAALEVVLKRASGLHLHDAFALVEDIRADRNALFQQIAKRIASIESFQKQHNQLETVVAERTFQTTSAEIQRLQNDFDALKDALFDDQFCGTSIKELYLSTDPQKSLGVTKLDPGYLKPKEVKQYRTLVMGLAGFAFTLEQEHQQWKDAAFWKNTSVHTRENIFQKLQWLQTWVKKQPIFCRLWIQTPDLLENCFRWFNQLETNLFFSFQEIDQFLNSTKKESQWVQSKIKKLQKIQEIEFQEHHLEALIHFDLFERAIEKSKHVTFFQMWLWLSSEGRKFQKICKALQVQTKTENIGVFFESLKSARLFSKIQNELIGWNLSAQEYCQSPQESAVYLENWLQLFEEGQKISSTLQICLQTDAKHVAKAVEKNWYVELRAFLEEIEILDQFLGKTVLQRWIEQPGLMEQASIQLEEQFEIIEAYYGLYNECPPVLKNIWPSIAFEATKYPPAEWFNRFQNEIQAFWIQKIEEKYPILKQVGQSYWKHAEENLQIAIAEKEKLAQQIVKLKLEENTYKNLNYNRLNNPTTYRALAHQVEKKKSLWSIRTLMEHFSEPLLQLMPCWLASPETVSAIFPFEADVFDLVIFDEASQCFAEEGLPILYRAKQVVVAGDSKQLQPNDIYNARWEEDEMETGYLPLSLLELCKGYFKTIMLEGHYRSQFPELIHFSNAHFYSDQLVMIPQAKPLKGHKPIEYIRTGGTWEKNGNFNEAEHLVNDVVNALQINKGGTIGIITFNIVQQDLILDLLERRRAEIPNEDLRSVFVKNIENVQGDEADVIYFSIGYAPDARGRFYMQFGSLNQEGGENRLNVAISRAKTQIKIYASIWPEDLKVEDSLRIGPKRLKQYLQMAYDMSKGVFRVETTLDTRFPVEWFLKQKLAASDSRFQKCSHFGDLMNAEEQTIWYTDDELLYNSKSSKHFYAYLPRAIQQKGWKYERKWSREWYHQQLL